MRRKTYIRPEVIFDEVPELCDGVAFAGSGETDEFLGKETVFEEDEGLFPADSLSIADDYLLL